MTQQPLTNSMHRFAWDASSLGFRAEVTLEGSARIEVFDSSKPAWVEQAPLAVAYWENGKADGGYYPVGGGSDGFIRQNARSHKAILAGLATFAKVSA